MGFLDLLQRAKGAAMNYAYNAMEQQQREKDRLVRQYESKVNATERKADQILNNPSKYSSGQVEKARQAKTKVNEAREKIANAKNK